jgi:type VI secretion system protein
MQNERLLERIRFIEENPDQRIRSDPAQITASVVRHLQRILNTKQGSTQIAEDYGLPDFTALVTSSFTSEGMKDLERSIREVIRKYEPRLSMVKVSTEPQKENAFSLYFKVDARLSTDKGDIPVVLQTVLTADGRMNIRE